MLTGGIGEDMNSERGNTIVYLLVGLVLFGVMIGGIWWVKQRSAGPLASPAANTKAVDSDNPADKSPESETKVDQDATTSTDESTNTEANPEPAATDSATESQDSPVAPASQPPISDDTVLLPESQTPRTGPSPANVAASGPVEDSIMVASGLGTLAFLGTSYARSRRSL